MNKRQAKKYIKKVSYLLVDELNLLTLSEEERKQAREDFHRYVQKHCKYKHYKDKYKCLNTSIYRYPVGKMYQQQMEQMLKTVCSYPINIYGMNK